MAAILLPVAGLFALGSLLMCLRALYRVTFHPLARCPGPRVAAVTSLWAASYDIPCKDSLVKHLKSLHDQYGPVVRVRPDEVHVFDWEAYRTTFRQGTNFYRPGNFYNNPAVNGSFFNNCDDPRGAKMHRDLYVQSFSKARIESLEPLIHEMINILLERLKEAAASDRIINLDMALQCLTADVTMHYCYQMSFDFLRTPNFEPRMIMDIHDSVTIIPTMWYLPTLGKVMNKLMFEMLPEGFVREKFPGVAALIGMNKRCRDLVVALRQSSADAPIVKASIFSGAMNPKQEKAQYAPSVDQMTGDAVLMFLAGTDTTSNALTVGIWEMIKQPRHFTQLRDELKTLMPTVSSTANVHDLERIPYLKALAKESIRFSLGTAARLPRIVPPGGTTFAGHDLPAGTKVSFSHYVYNNDPAIFPDPHTFRPERWLGSKEEVDVLEAHMVSFSRGSRSCVGMNLAYAEFYTAMAHLVRAFDIQNAGTTQNEIDWYDSYTPSMNGHLKVKLKALAA